MVRYVHVFQDAATWCFLLNACSVIYRPMLGFTSGSVLRTARYTMLGVLWHVKCLNTGVYDSTYKNIKAANAIALHDAVQ